VVVPKRIPEEGIMPTQPLDFYRQHSPATDPGKYSALFDKLPSDLAELHRIVQNVLIHVWKIRKYHPHLLRSHEIESRRVEDMLALINEHDPQPVTIERPIEKKLIVDCRHFAGFLCALLRHQSIPARSRNGFATYLETSHYQDHWATQYWNATDQRWVMDDADLKLHDIPADKFIVAGQAWQACRTEQDTATKYGYGSDWCGWYAISNNLVHDLASLNQAEELSLGTWGIMTHENIPFSAYSAADVALLDAAAAHTQADNQGFAAMRDFYQQSERLRVPPTLQSHNYITDRFTTVEAV
jgi:hypothetical protein